MRRLRKTVHGSRVRSAMIQCCVSVCIVLTGVPEAEALSNLVPDLEIGAGTAAKARNDLELQSRHTPCGQQADKWLTTRASTDPSP